MPCWAARLLPGRQSSVSSRLWWQGHQPVARCGIPLPQVGHNARNVEAERGRVSSADRTNILDDFIRKRIARVIVRRDHVSPPTILLVCRSPALRSPLRRTRPRCGFASLRSRCADNSRSGGSPFREQRPPQHAVRLRLPRAGSPPPSRDVPPRRMRTRSPPAAVCQST